MQSIQSEFITTALELPEMRITKNLGLVARHRGDSALVVVWDEISLICESRAAGRKIIGFHHQPRPLERMFWCDLLLRLALRRST